eukprot:scaffold8745_cov113-Isochrysis_galbana.AAC.3
MAAAKRPAQATVASAAVHMLWLGACFAVHFAVLVRPKERCQTCNRHRGAYPARDDKEGAGRDWAPAHPKAPARLHFARCCSCKYVTAACTLAHMSRAPLFCLDMDYVDM